jgi:peptide subunit release factor 1 (eRF1)
MLGLTNPWSAPTMKCMNTTENNLITAELAAEMHQAVENAAKGIRDTERVKRARKSMDCIREEIRKKHGVLDIGVPAIRELRDQ